MVNRARVVADEPVTTLRDLSRAAASHALLISRSLASRPSACSPLLRLTVAPERLAVALVKWCLCVVRAAPIPDGRRDEGAPTMDTNADLLTTAEVALITRAPVSTVRYWRHLGTGPRSFRLGRRVVYRRHEVEQWLRERETADTSATAG